MKRKYDPNIHHRRSIRLRGFDYSEVGAYFITISTQNRECLFGNVVDGKMVLNDAGRMIETVWCGLPERFPQIELPENTVMPNHFHGIVTIVGAPLVGAQSPVDTAESDNLVGETGRAGTGPAPTGITDEKVSLGEIVGAFKSITTHAYICGVKQFGWPPFPGKLWQRNYYEHIVRNENELKRIRSYIVSNPMHWELNQENPSVWTPQCS